MPVFEPPKLSVGLMRTTSNVRVFVSFFVNVAAAVRLATVLVASVLTVRPVMDSRALAERVGCSSSYVSKLETQGMVPAANVFARLVNVLECSDAEIQFLLILLEKM